MSNKRKTLVRNVAVGTMPRVQVDLLMKLLNRECCRLRKYEEKATDIGAQLIYAQMRGSVQGIWQRLYDATMEVK